MKIYGFLILMTTAVILFSTSEVSAMEDADPGQKVCIDHDYVHRCARPNRDDYSGICGEHAKCDKPGQPGAKCVCEDNWAGPYPSLGCPTSI